MCGLLSNISTPAVAVGEAAQQLEEEEPHVAPRQPAGVLLQVLRQVRVLQEEKGRKRDSVSLA